MIALLQDDGHALLRDVGADAAEVIPVMVRAHQVANRLVRDQLLHLGDDRQRSILVERRLDHRDEIPELDGHARVRAAADIPETVSDFRRLDADGRNRRRARRVGNRRGGIRRIHLHVARW